MVYGLLVLIESIVFLGAIVYGPSVFTELIVTLGTMVYGLFGVDRVHRISVGHGVRSLGVCRAHHNFGYSVASSIIK